MSRLTAVILTVCLLWMALAQTSRRAHDDRGDGTAPMEWSDSPATALRQAITVLETEANGTRDSGRLARASADIAREIPTHIPASHVEKMLLKKADRDPFVDAYVRWQLTSLLDQDWTPNERTIERLMRQLPALIDNPRASDQVIREARRLVEGGELNERGREVVSQGIDELNERSVIARQMNKPARDLRTWLIERTRDDAPRHLLLEMEYLEAHVKAGWSVEGRKNRVEDAFRDAARSAEMSDADKRTVEEHAMRLIEIRRLYVSRMDIAGDTVAVGYGDAAVYDFDVRRWLRLIR